MLSWHKIAPMSSTIVEYYALGQQARLESIGCVLNFDLIYEHVEFGEAEEASSNG
jgi:hypothetical protein